ncbi:MAG: ABC transporter substrate-binding protein [Burkholderiaceae bacterium]
MSVRFEYGAPTSQAALLTRYAIRKGLFGKEGIEASVRVVHGGPELAAAYDRGELNMGEMGSPPAITQISKGRKFRIIGSATRRGVALFLATRPEISSLDELRGRTLGALSTGSCSDWYLRQILIQNGIQPDTDVKVRSLGADHERVSELIAQGEIGAALVGGILVAAGEDSGTLRSWGPANSLAQVPELQWSVLVANDRFRQTEPELARTVVEILRQAGAAAQADPDEWIAFNASVYQVSAPVARRAVELERPFTHFEGRLDLAGLANAVRLQHQLGAIERATPLDQLVAEMA